VNGTKSAGCKQLINPLLSDESVLSAFLRELVATPPLYPKF